MFETFLARTRLPSHFAQGIVQFQAFSVNKIKELFNLSGDFSCQSTYSNLNEENQFNSLKKKKEKRKQTNKKKKQTRSYFFVRLFLDRGKSVEG